MRSCEPCRVDITIPGKYIYIYYILLYNKYYFDRGNNTSSRYHHVILFESEEVRQNWVGDIQMTKLRQSQSHIIYYNISKYIQMKLINNHGSVMKIIMMILMMMKMILKRREHLINTFFLIICLLSLIT